jgi:hypothetical protein
MAALLASLFAGANGARLRLALIGYFAVPGAARSINTVTGTNGEH